MVKFDLFCCLAHDQKSPPQRKETSLNIFGKEVDLARSLFHKQHNYHQKSMNKYRAELSFGSSRNTLSQRAHYLKKQRAGF